MASIRSGTLARLRRCEIALGHRFAPADHKCSRPSRLPGCFQPGKRGGQCIPALHCEICLSLDRPFHKQLAVCDDTALRLSHDTGKNTDKAEDSGGHLCAEGRWIHARRKDRNYLWLHREDWGSCSGDRRWDADNRSSAQFKCVVSSNLPRCIGKVGNLEPSEVGSLGV